MLAPDMMNFVQSTMNLDDYSERNYGVAHRTQTQEKRTMQELQYKFAVVQGLKWPLGLC